MLTQNHNVDGALRLTWRVSQLAEAVGLSERQIYRLQGEGKLAGIKVGRARLITDESVRRWLSDLQHGGVDRS